MIKWLIENENTEWYKPHFYIWRSDRMAENLWNERIPVWTKDANEAWSFECKEDADKLIESMKDSFKFKDLTLKATEHEFI